MYVDASDSCNDLTFTLAALSKVSRSWSIRVTQFEKGHENLAPSGCTQWFFNVEGVGTIQSYNYAEKVHLADQNQVVCIRREAKKSKICYYADLPDISLSGKGANVMDDVKDWCGGYKGDGSGLYRDALLIPSLVTANGNPAATATAGAKVFSNVCGVGQAFHSLKTVCSKKIYFFSCIAIFLTCFCSRHVGPFPIDLHIRFCGKQ